MEALGLDKWEFWLAIANFAILLFLLTKFLYKPILKMLEERKVAIDEALNAADAARLEVASTEESLRKEIAQARMEADAIIADAKKRGEEVQDKLITDAKSEAKSITEAATDQIEKEKNKAILDLKVQIADMALLATEKILGDGLTPAQEKNLMDKYIKEVGHIQ